MRAVALATLVALLVPPALAAQGAAVDPRLSSALRDAVDGRLDSARATLAVLAKDVTPASPAYPDLLFGQALVASSITDARQALQRLVVEHPLSPWADDAALRLTQLEYAAGDRAAALRQAERFRTEHAQSPLFPQAALWAGRAALASKDSVAGCGWIADGVARGGDDAPTRASLAALQRKCGGKAPAVAAAPAAPAPVTAPPAAAPAKEATKEPARRDGAARPVAVLSAPWRVQIIAAKTAAQAEQALAAARKAGFDGAVTQEGGYHKVRLGGFATRGEAAAAAKRVQARLGGKPYVVQAP